MPTDYFISYASPDQAWAEWIAWELEETGATVTLQSWDFGAGSNFVLEMQRAAADAQRTIAVLSPDYLASHFAAPEWAAAFAQDLEGLKRKLVPVRVRSCTIEGMLKPIVYIDLVGLDKTAARKQLLDRLTTKRGKPDRAPPFPGQATGGQPEDKDQAKPFPGGGGSYEKSPTGPVPYVPKIRGAISDLDRSRFVKGAFGTIRSHFDRGLAAMAENAAIDGELTRRSETEFVAEVFINGKRSARCRVWLEGMIGSANEIGYYEGDHDMGNALNEVLTLTDERETLALKALMNMGFGGSRLPQGLDPRRMTVEEAAEYLWRRFLWRLE